MKRVFIGLFICFAFTRTVYAQCDKTLREKIIVTALSYFQDSKNRSYQNPVIILADTTQYSDFPTFSFEPDLVMEIPDTTILYNLILGHKKVIEKRESLSMLRSCQRIRLITCKDIHDINNDTDTQRQFFYNNAKGYYLVTEPFIEQNYAVIYVENFCGSLCGSGYVFYLKLSQDTGEWMIIYSRQTWVS